MKRALVLTPKFTRAFRKFARHDARLQKRIQETLQQIAAMANQINQHKASIYNLQESMANLRTHVSLAIYRVALDAGLPEDAAYSLSSDGTKLIQGPQGSQGATK